MSACDPCHYLIVYLEVQVGCAGFIIAVLLIISSCMLGFCRVFVKVCVEVLGAALSLRACLGVSQNSLR